MLSDSPLFPVQASTAASQVDNLYFLLLAIAGFFSVLIFSLVVYFAIRYRRRSELEVPRPIEGSIPLELTWTIIPFIISMGLFVWGSSVFFQINRPPSDAIEMLVVAKQWMWKIQHPEGPREINTFHVPVGQAIKMTMTSEDVIHSFFIPAFRVKMDVLPGRYTSVWFEATKVGTYHLFCAEYCGTKHSGMKGWVYVMEPTEYERWLSDSASGEPMQVSGEKLFQQFRCDTCHADQSGERGPSLRGLYGSSVQLEDGTTAVADETYLRESILNPNARIVSGYRPLMPTFQGQINESDLLHIITYIKALPKGERTTTGE